MNRLYYGDNLKVQILTVGELREDRRIDYPAERQTNQTFKKARRHDGEAVPGRLCLGGAAPPNDANAV
jgi:hypothetical protein